MKVAWEDLRGNLKSSSQCNKVGCERDHRFENQRDAKKWKIMDHIWLRILDMIIILILMFIQYFLKQEINGDSSKTSVKSVFALNETFYRLK